MLRIRLRRVGAKKQPSYRVVVADSKSARDGSFVDYLGHYNPRTEPSTVEIDEDKVKQFIKKYQSSFDMLGDEYMKKIHSIEK